MDQQRASNVVDDLPEPMRCIALGLVDDLLSHGYSRDQAERNAAELAVSFAAERMWDFEELDGRWLLQIDVYFARAPGSDE